MPAPLVSAVRAAIPLPVSPAPSPTRLYLVRHGEVDHAWQGRIYGALDVPLSDAGRRAGERVARTLAGVELAAVVRPLAMCCRARVTTCRALASASRRTLAMSR